MNLSRLALVTSLGLGLFSTGCLGAPEALSDDGRAPPRLVPLEGNAGGVGPNGLETEFFHPRKLQLLDASRQRLLDSSSNLSAGVLATGLMDTKEGLKTFDYAAKCALSEGVTVFAAGDPYQGGGLLGTTTSWPTAPLGLAAQEDLFACMIAHLNPSGHEVMIQLTGAAIPVDTGDQSMFSFEEAVWIAKVGSSFALEFHVWPLSDLESTCGHGVVGSLQTRVCGEALEDCGLHVRDDIASACTVSTQGDYTCDGQPAIKTQLKPEDVSTLHGGCGL